MEAAPSYRYSVCEIPSGILCSHRKAISVEVTTKNARLSPNKMLNEMKGKLYSGVTRRGFAAGAVEAALRTEGLSGVYEFKEILLNYE